MDSGIIIIGGGMAGLLAARDLSAAGKKIILLEAANRLGGRVNTIHDPAFDHVLETGAEFIHGNLPLTISLLTEAGIPFYKIAGEMMQVKNNELQDMNEGMHEWDAVFEKMQTVKEDMVLSAFLETYFPGGKYAALRNSIRHYAEGFDLADPDTASTIALGKEWNKEEEAIYRVDGGYGRLTEYLVNACRQNGVRLQTASPVKTIHWQKDNVAVYTDKGEVFTGNKVLITVPLKILQYTAHEKGAISFTPAIPGHIESAGKIGYGTVIKLFFQFKEAFWIKDKMKPGLIISNQLIPTWWTQLPNESMLLTGWLGGPGAKALRDADLEIILRLGLVSLANIFSEPPGRLRSILQAWRIMDWSAAPFINGGYSFPTLETMEARKLLQVPVEETIYFSGEALHDGDAPGTVEAALASGQKAANTILSHADT